MASAFREGHSSNNGQAFPTMIVEGKSDCAEVEMSVTLRDPLMMELRWDLEGNKLFRLGGLNRVLIKPCRSNALFNTEVPRVQTISSSRIRSLKGNHHPSPARCIAGRLYTFGLMKAKVAPPPPPWM
ncbi:hypothetical protein CRG98_006494 [Punica granatum]|uniref:Uncharacterized protein n=1 Tax=Punica granatum TaxID=22663 RepID=A0A2I0KZ06_PUNGR|nr:hypothetical protein CRG98_006494 [Punica granatum]